MLAEVAPFLSPQFDGLLLSLFVVAGALVSLGIVLVLHRFVRATVGGVASLIGHVPGIGSVLSSPLNAVYHWMEHEFSAAELALDKAIGRYLHSLAELVRWVARELEASAHLAYLIATVLVGTEAMHLLNAGLRLVRHELRRVEHSALVALHRIEAIERGIEHAASGAIGAAMRSLLRPLEAEVHGLERWTYPRVGALERAVEGTIPRAIADLRGWVRDLTDEYARLWQRIRALEHALSTEALTAAIAVALAAIGAEWIRCRNWRGIGRSVCGLPAGLIESLLADAIEALIVADICELANLIEAAAVAIEPLLDELVNLEAFICLAGGASYPSGIVDADFHGGAGLASGIVPADLAA